MKVQPYGKTNPEELLAATTGRLHAARATLLEALRGRIRAPHRFLLKLHLGQIDALEQSIADIDKEVGALLEPFRAKAKRLMTIPGISNVAAQVLVSEIGIDMSRFPTVGTSSPGPDSALETMRVLASAARLAYGMEPRG